MPGYTHRQQYQTFFSQDLESDRPRLHRPSGRVSGLFPEQLQARPLQNTEGPNQNTYPRKSRQRMRLSTAGPNGSATTIENEQEILDALTKSGFIGLDIASDGLDHIIATLGGAKLVVSIEGSRVCPICTSALRRIVGCSFWSRPTVTGSSSGAGGVPWSQGFNSSLGP